MLSDRPRLILITIAVAVVVAWVFALVPTDRLLHVTFLDVGEGLCIAIRTPSGKTAIVDCGTSSWRQPEIVGQRVAGVYLRSLGADSVDLAVLTHPHSDHLSGFAHLFTTLPPRLVLDSGTKHPSPLYGKFLDQVRRIGAEYRVATPGQIIDMGDGVTMQVLNSAAGPVEDVNDASIVLRVAFGRVAVLLTGDAGSCVEQRMIDSGSPLKAQVLQVAHHGSDDATSTALLRAVSPNVAVISCGRRNEYGHPSRAVVHRLETRGIRVYRTDMHGAVTVTTDGESIRVRPFRTPQ